MEETKAGGLAGDPWGTCTSCRSRPSVLELEVWDTATGGTLLALCEQCRDRLSREDARFCASSPCTRDERIRLKLRVDGGWRKITLCDEHLRSSGTSLVQTPRPL